MKNKNSRRLMTIPGDNPLAYEGVVAPNPPNLIRSPRAPTTEDLSHLTGTFWLNTVTEILYVLVRNAAGIATWQAFGGSGGSVDTINSLSPTAGNIIIAPTANQIATANAGSTVTLSLPAALVAPGSITATTTITATLGDITVTNGDVVLGTAGNKLRITEGANASMGIGTLVAGELTIATTAVTANSRIFLSRQGIGATLTDLGMLIVPTITAGVSFVINAVDPTDATVIAISDLSLISWLIIN